MGQYVETQVARDLSELLENSEPQLGSMFGDFRDRARARARARETISSQIASQAPPGLLTDELSADDVMDVLYSAA